MIYRIIESKIAFAITAGAFLFALVWNFNQGAGLSLPGHGIFAPAAVADSISPVAAVENIVPKHGPTLPPDPWAGDGAFKQRQALPAAPVSEVLALKHGPTLPPDPWAGDLKLIAHGPTLPPDPWAGDGALKQRQALPAAPVSEVLALKHGPTLPPDPWAGDLKLIAHGPTLPPDPWAGDAALKQRQALPAAALMGVLALKHGPTLPPDPWAGDAALKHSLTLPPRPWEVDLKRTRA